MQRRHGPTTTSAMYAPCCSTAGGGRRPGWTQPAEIYLAVLYHDAIYHAGRKDNEARSAQLALQAIAQAPELAAVDAARVGQLILLTARHGELGPQDVDAEAALFWTATWRSRRAGAGVCRL